MKIIRRSALFRLAVSLLSASVPITTVIAESATDLCAVSASALRRSSEIRGLEVRKEVPCVTQDKTEVREFLEETIRTELPPDKMEMEQLAYRAIGMIPDDYEYGKNLVKFLVSELGGYYDPKRCRFVMAAWLPASVQQTVAVHELTHALQDQHFNLRALLGTKSDNGDKSLAYSALIEGDATAVMLDYDRRQKLMSGLAEVQNIESSILLQIVGMNIGGAAGEVPASLKAMLIFPYTSGLRFAHTILRRQGYAGLNAVYKRPPQSTREILHPEEYIAGGSALEIPSESELTSGACVGTARGKIDYTDVIGEFGISSLLSNSSVPVEARTRASIGWKGDRVVVCKKDDRYRVVRWLTRWDSESDAHEFLEAYTKYLGERYKVSIGVGETRLSDTKSVEIRVNKQEVLAHLRVPW